MTLYIIMGRVRQHPPQPQGQQQRDGFVIGDLPFDFEAPPAEVLLSNSLRPSRALSKSLQTRFILAALRFLAKPFSSVGWLLLDAKVALTVLFFRRFLLSLKGEEVSFADVKLARTL